MAAFNEERLEVNIILGRTQDGNDHILLHARTLDAEGTVQIRRVKRDIWDRLTPARKKAIKSLIDEAVAFLITELDLPDDVMVGPSAAVEPGP